MSRENLEYDGLYDWTYPDPTTHLKEDSKQAPAKALLAEPNKEEPKEDKSSLQLAPEIKLEVKGLVEPGKKEDKASDAGSSVRAQPGSGRESGSEPAGSGDDVKSGPEGVDSNGSNGAGEEKKGSDSGSADEDKKSGREGEEKKEGEQKEELKEPEKEVEKDKEKEKDKDKDKDKEEKVTSEEEKSTSRKSKKEKKDDDSSEKGSDEEDKEKDKGKEEKAVITMKDLYKSKGSGGLLVDSEGDQAEAGEEEVSR